MILEMIQSVKKCVALVSLALIVCCLAGLFYYLPSRSSAPIGPPKGEWIKSIDVVLPKSACLKESSLLRRCYRMTVDDCLAWLGSAVHYCSLEFSASEANDFPITEGWVGLFSNCTLDHFRTWTGGRRRKEVQECNDFDKWKLKETASGYDYFSG